MASSVATASPTNVLTSLPARPPTPPREASHEADVSLKSVILGRMLAFDPRLSLQTPPNTHPPTSPVPTGSHPSSGRTRKKVEWSAHTDYREPPQYSHDNRAAKSSPLSAPSSATSSRPVKGILKPSSSPNPLAASLTSGLHGPSSPLNIVEMLDSTIKQLAGSDRDSKLDAYMMLSRALKASNNLPDRVALQDKMSLFMQFIQRDMTAKLKNGNLDTSLVNHSLTLLATFLHFPAIASTLNTDFGIFVIDHSIRSFEDETMPKDVIRHLMQAVAFQNFSPKTMTSERVGRLVTALHKIESHLTGKSIVMSRLHIYKRLIKQSRNHMSAHLDWLKDMFTDMLSSIKDIRSQAISLGMEAGFALRSEKQLLRKATDLFQTANDSETYIDFYIKRLQGMIKEKHMCNSVPQIWSVVILFLRCPLDRWQYYGPWLTLAQSAFNMTDNSTKQEANYAWNRYVYLSLSDTKVSPKCIGTLCQPLISQLRRKWSPKQQEEATRMRRVVIGGVCNLYYYSFAPGSDKYDTDVLWDVAVQPIISQLISLEGKPHIPGDGIMQAARLLVGLLDVATPRIWRQDRIVDTPPVKPDELPAIDSRWVRRNCDKVLQLVGPIIEKKFLDLANKDSLIYRLWQALVGSVTAASAKDIKVSDETAKFVGCAFGLLSTAFMAEPVEPEPAWSNLRLLPSVYNLIHVLIDGLGLLPFTEKRLSMTVPNTFESISTPSQGSDRANKSQGVVRMPLHHLLVMLAAVPPGGTDDNALASFLQSVFEPFLRGRTAKGRFDLAKELLQLLPRNTQSPYGPWMLAADCAKAYLDSRSCVTTGSIPTPDKMSGPEYREIVSLIERGLTCHPNLPPNQWISLFSSITTQITNDFGDAGCSLVVIEPLAKAILDMSASVAEKPSNLIVQAVTSILHTAKLPRDRQALEAARSKLWGAPVLSTKTTPFEPLDYMYKISNHILAASYDRHSDADVAGTSNAILFLEAVGAFLAKHVPLFGIKVLGKFQSGLGVWIRDEKSSIHGDNQSSVFCCVTTIWDQICSTLAQEDLDKADLDKIEPLLASAFQSTHAAIMNSTAATWNAIMKHNTEIECSANLMSIISSVQSKVDLVVPSANKGSDESVAPASPKAGQQADFSLRALSSASSNPNVSVATADSRQSTTRRAVTRKRRLEMTPELPKAKPKKRTSTPRLRHDNSQIRFKPILSSPLRDESQHLTERQKEVRERQRQNAVIYSSAQSSSPPPSTGGLSRQRADSSAPAPESGIHAQKSTPKRNKSFEDLISSTPTPRRGEVFQMDDFNDPPSSPPVPRPYPLLSEIQSRSRAGSTMESWEFSSPPGSPTGNQQTEEAALPPTPSIEASLPRSRRSSKRQRREAAGAHQSLDTAAVDKPEKQSMLTAWKANDQSDERSCRAHTTSVQGVLTRARRAQETPKGQKALPKTSDYLPRRRSSRRADGSTMMAAEKVDETPNTGAASEAQGATTQSEQSASRLVPDSQSVDPTDGAIATPIGSRGCIMVHTDSTCPSPEKLGAAVVETPTRVMTSGEETTQKTEVSGSRKKRKRGGKHTDKSNKRLRSNGGTDTGELQTPQTKQFDFVAPKPSDEIGLVEGVETRSGRRNRQSRAIWDEPKKGPKHAKRESKGLKRAVDDGDTDEEVQSQLVTESNAASQISQPDAEDEAAVSNDIKVAGAHGEKMELEPAVGDDEALAALSDTEAGAQVSARGEEVMTILQTLRSGLDQLRTVSLTRGKVYEVEDILMDMKRELFEAERRGRDQPKNGKPSDG